MVMKGVQDFGAVEACVMAILAGVDMFIYRNADLDTIKVIEGVIAKAENNEALKRQILKANERIEALKKKYL